MLETEQGASYTGGSNPDSLESLQFRIRSPEMWKETSTPLLIVSLHKARGMATRGGGEARMVIPESPPHWSACFENACKELW